MRAAIFEQPGTPLRIVDGPEPVPASDEVLIRVGRCGICASDLHMTAGHEIGYPAGSRLGHEYAGTVVAVGSDVGNLAIGDHLAAMAMGGCGHCRACLAGTPVWCATPRSQKGGFAEYALVHRSAAIRLPNTLSMADGALVEPLAVGLHGVALARMEPGARVLVVGLGAVGLAAIYWARRLGAGRIAGLARTSRNGDHALALGADGVVARGEAVEDRVRQVLDGPPDVVLECVGASGLIDEAVAWVRPRGTVVVLGLCCEVDGFAPARALFKEVTIRFAFLYSSAEFEFVARRLDADPAAPHAMISQTVSLDALPQVFEQLRGGHDQCKVHVDPWAT